MFSLKIITDLEQFQYQVENFEKTVTKLIQAKKKMSTKPTSAQPINSQLQQTPIAIVGMASIFPQAENVQQYWENIYREVDCITSVPASHWDVDAYYDPDPMAIDKTYCTRGGFIPEIDFNPMEFGLPPNFLEVTDVSQLLSLVVAKQAMADAGYGESSPFNRDRTGITLGVAVGRPLATPLTCRLQYPIWERVLKNSGISAAETDKIIENLKLAYVGWQENAFPGLLGNVVAGRIANRLDLGGTNCTVDAACASSLAAFKMAVSELIEDRCNLMITGGVDTDNSIFTYLCFSKTPALSRKQQSKPFDEDADGILLGEGIGMVVLKRLADAERDGDRIYAVIKGIGSSSDGRFKSIYAPRQEGQVNALQRAYQDAGVEPASIGLIEAHGTGTFAGDPAEFEALKQVFSSGQVGRQSIALGSVKSQIGHTKAAAGAASLIKAALALHQKILPPTINITQPNPKLDLENSPFYLNTKPRPWIQPHGSDPRRAGVSAFGFGGTNFHVVLEEYGGNPETNSLGSPRPQRLHKTPESMVLFASTPDRLFLECETTLLQLQSETGEQRYIEWVDASRSLDMPLSAARVGFLADSLAEACQKLKTAVAWMRKQPNLSAWDHPQGIYYRAAGLDLQGKVVALFSGQGSQYPDMGRELAINFPEIQDAYSQIDSLFSQEGLQPPSTIVFPPPVFTDEHRQTQVEALRNTEYAQSAIGAFSVGLFKIMEQAGFQPDFVAGHSFGELTALWAAKVLSDKDYFALVKARGQAMAASPAPDADAGAMLAVKAEVSVVEAAITGVPEVAIANLNSPQQVVLAGTRSAIISLQAKMQSQGILATLLPVAAAFHTPLVAHAQKPFAQAVAATSFQSPQIPVYTNITGQPYPNEPRAIQKLLKEHLLNRVLFKQEIETISAKGGYCFVEFGPKAVLTNLVKEILGDVPHIAIALNASSKEDSDRQFREAVLQLRIAGLALKNIDPYALAPSAPVVKRSKANVRLCGANYLSENTQRAFDKALGNSDPATLSEAQVAPQTAASKMLTMTALTLNGSTSIETLEPLVADHPPPTFSPNGVSAHRSALALNQPTPEMESQIMPDLALNYQHFFDGLEHSVVQLNQHQSETLQVHSQYLNHQMEYAKIFLHLMQQQNTLFSDSPQNGSKPAPESRLAMLESLERNMSRFHDHQTDTLRVHERSLQDQTEYTQNLFHLMQQRCSLLLEGGQTASFYSAWEQTLQTQARIKAAPVTQPEIPKPQLTADPVPVAASSAAPPVQFSSNGNGIPASISPPESLSGNGSAVQTPIAGKIEQTPVVDAPSIHTSTDSTANLSTILLAIVSEKTGYPVEMLELEMDMEADLGIDSIKRVEILGALQAQFPSSVQPNPDDLAELRTLGQIVAYMQAQPLTVQSESAKSFDPVNIVDAKAPAISVNSTSHKGDDHNGHHNGSGNGDSVTTTVAASAATLITPKVDLPSLDQANRDVNGNGIPPSLQKSITPAVIAVDSSRLSEHLLAVVSEKTGYPAEMLEMEMDMEADLGIDSIKRVEILGALQERFPASYEPTPEDLAELRTLNQIVSFLGEQVAEKKTANQQLVASPVS